MNAKNTTPPQTFKRKVLFSYDERKFKKTISRLTPDLLKDIKISVFSTPDKDGNCIEILTSNLQDTDFDALAETAAYTMYEGSCSALSTLGVA